MWDHYGGSTKKIKDETPLDASSKDHAVWNLVIEIMEKQDGNSGTCQNGGRKCWLKAFCPTLLGISFLFSLDS